ANCGERVAGHVGGSCAVRGYQGQSYDELASVTQAGTARLDAPTMQLQHAAHEGQADPESPARTRQRAVDLREQIEDPLELLRCQADTVVTHAQDGLVILLRDLQCNVAAVLSVFGGVLDEVRDDLFQPNRIAVDPHGSIGQGEYQIVMVLSDATSARLGRMARDVSQIQRFALELNVTTTDARDVEELIDEPDEPPGLSLNHVVKLR